MAKILIVDDSALTRRILRRALEPAGHSVVEAEDGFQGLERYAAEKPDLVILDMIMPGLEGLEVLPRILEINPQARVVISTADVQTSTRSMAREAGASGFINKPVDAGTLLKIVGDLLNPGS
jgi:two-component system, chemotaxis family, chemotaxis protein CheY